MSAHICNGNDVLSFQAHITQLQPSEISRFSWFLCILGPLAFFAVLFCHPLGDVRGWLGTNFDLNKILLSHLKVVLYMQGGEDP